MTQPESTERCAVDLECDCNWTGPGNERRCVMEPKEGGGCDCRCHWPHDRLLGALAEAEKELEETRAESAKAMLFQNQKVTAHEHAASAAEERAAQAERALTELLRLYDWRFELAEREKLGERNALSEDFKAETRRQLRQYGAEKKAAWEATRKVLKRAHEAMSRESTTHTPERPKDG